MQARSQEDDLPCEDRELSIGSVLRVASSGETGDTNDISSAQVLVLSVEVTLSILGLANDLHLDTFRANVVENQLVTLGTLGIDSSRDAHLHIRLLFALGETLIILEVLSEVDGDLELVRVGVGVLGLSELVDLLASNLEVLLSLSIHVSHPAHQKIVTMRGFKSHVRGEVALRLLLRHLLLGLRRSSSLLFLLLGLLLPLLLASLQFGLGDLFAGDLVEEEVGHGGLSLLNSGIRHNELEPALGVATKTRTVVSRGG